MEALLLGRLWPYNMTVAVMGWVAAQEVGSSSSGKVAVVAGLG